MIIKGLNVDLLEVEQMGFDDKDATINDTLTRKVSGH